MKRTLSLLLAALLGLGALAGCGQARFDSVFQSDHEILTYQKVDPARTQIVVSRTGNLTVEDFCREFEARNPDVQVIYLDITGGNSTYMPLIDWITKGYVPDIVISGADFFSEELTVEHFENLSASPIIQNYEAAALKRTATQDNIYWLPGPSSINAIMYNKTLFERYGWELPSSFDEFVALCDQIRADTNGTVEAWNPNAKYDAELLTALEAFTYAEIFGGAENRSWYNDFITGHAAFTGHMEPYTQVIQTLVDHDILREEHFSYSATARGKEFAAGQIAMINGNLYDADNDDFDFGYMPFPSTTGELGYVCDSYSCFVGLPLKERSAPQRDAAERFLAFFSSGEGQQIYIGNAMKVSNVKNVPLNQSDDFAALQPVIDAGHLFATLDFASPAGLTRGFGLFGIAADITQGKKTGSQFIEEADRQPYLPASASAQEAPEVLATAGEDLSVLETSFLLADMYRETAGAEIGLITHGQPYRGNLMRIFSGDITGSHVSVLKPRSFANDAALLKVSMTGRQLLDALDHPVGNEAVPDCIYAYSGLSCRVAPWNPPGAKYLSVKLADGTALEEDRLYTVALWAGTVAEEYITETLESYEGTWEELATAWLRAAGTVAPCKDGRIRLVWEDS